MPGLDPVHSWPPTYLALLPWAGAQIISTRILQPGDPSSSHIAFKHKWAIVMANHHVGQAIACEITGEDANRGIKLADDIFLPF
jgi:hypothetical protein